MQHSAHMGALMFGLSHELWVKHIARGKAKLAQYQVLVISLMLHKAFQNKTTLSISEFCKIIFDHFGWDNKTTLKYIELMQAENLIVLENSTQDRRKKFVLMTDEMMNRWASFNNFYQIALRDHFQGRFPIEAAE